VDGLELVHQLIDQLPAFPESMGLALELDPQQVHAVRTRLASIWPNREIQEVADGHAVRGVLCWK
jgi:hypothetical protein